MDIRNHLKKVDTLYDAEEIILVCGAKTHHQLFLCIINTHQVMESTIEDYTLDVHNLRKIIGKIYSRQNRKRTQLIIHDVEAMIEVLETDPTLNLASDIELVYTDLLDFKYKDKRYILESVSALEQNVFRYFDLYGKLNEMYYMGIYRMLEYIISIMDGVSPIQKGERLPQQTSIETNQKSKDVTVIKEEVSQFKENQLIVLFEGESSVGDMMSHYAIKWMRVVEGQLEDLKSMTTYTKRQQTSKDKSLYFVKEFYGTCRFLQGKYQLDEILIIGEDAKEFIKIIYNVAGAIELMDLSPYCFVDVLQGGWIEKWEALIGVKEFEKLEFNRIKEALLIAEGKIGIDQKNYKSLYQVSVNAILLKLMILYHYNQEAYKAFLKELQ